MNSPSFDHDLDLMGLKCPLPALKTAKFLKSLTPGARLQVRCSDPMAVIDIPNLLNTTGDILVSQSEDQGALVFLIRKAGA